MQAHTNILTGFAVYVERKQRVYIIFFFVHCDFVLLCVLFYSAALE